MKMENELKLNRTNFKYIDKEYKLKIYPDKPKCSLCGEYMCSDEEYDKFLKFKSFPNSKYLFIPLFYENDLYFREVCETCLEKKFPNKKYNTLSKQTQFALQIDDDLFKKIKSDKLDTVSKQSFIKRYGEIEGVEKFKEYSKKQSYSNSYEYFKEKYNWTKTEYDEYNKSRSVTLENSIKRHGEEKGIKIFNDYCQRQSYSNTLEYFVETYGEYDGLEKYVNFCGNRAFSVSKISVKLFDKIKEKFPNLKMYYGDCEYSVFNVYTNRYNSIDFTIPELKYCIEYNGDLFHANPKTFSRTDKPNPFNRDLTSEDIWKTDETRLKNLSNLNYDYDIIWDTEYKSDSSKIEEYIFNKIKELYENRKDRKN